MTGATSSVCVERLERAISDGSCLGAQLYVSVGAEVWVDIAVGERIPGAALGTDDPVAWVCCAKPLGALALGLLYEGGAVTPETRVSSVVPEYAVGGKAEVTIAQLLSHSVPYEADGVDRVEQPPLVHLPHEKALAMACARQLRASPGSGALYSPFGSWVVLAEIVAKLTGTGYFDFVEREILKPLEMDAVIFGDAMDTASLADLYRRDDEGYVVDDLENLEGMLAPGSPGSGAHGPARELARVFECLVHDGRWNGKRVLGQKAVRALSSTVRQGLPDPVFWGWTLDWGLGVCTDSDWFWVPKGTRLVGHTGYGCALAMGDLDRRIVISFLSTSVASEPMGRGRLMGRIVRDVYAAVASG